MANRVVEFLLKVKDEATQPLDKAGRSAQGFGDKLTSIAKAVGALAAGAALGAFFKSSIEESLAAEKALTKLQQAVTNTGEDFATLRPALDAAAVGLQRVTTFGDDDAREALARLTTTTGSASKAMDLLGLAADVASYKGIGLAEAADIVGKASNGQVRVLKEFGITTTDAGAAMDQLREKVGGFAEAEAQTFGGRLKQINNLWSDFKEAVGNAIVGSDSLGASTNVVADALAGMAEWVDANSERIGALVSAIVDVASAVGSILLGAFRLLLPVAAPVLEFVAKGFQVIRAGIGAAVEGLATLVEYAAKALPGKFGESVAAAAQAAKAWGKETTQAAADAILGFKGLDTQTVKTTKLFATLGTDGAAGVDRVAGKVKAAREETVSLAKVIGDLDVQIIAVAGQIERLADVQQRRAELQKSLEENRLRLQQATASQMAEITRQIQRQQAEAARLAEEEARRRAVVIETGRQIADVARATIGLGQAAGAFSAEMAAALNNVVSLGTALNSIAMNGLNAQGIIGVVGALGGLLKSIFSGQSEAQRQAAALLQRNTDALRDVTSAFSLQTAGGKLAAALGALEEMVSRASMITGLSSSDAMEILTRTGLTWSELDRIFKDLGFEGSLRDKNGRLNLGAADLLIEALRKAQTTQPVTIAQQRAALDAQRSAGLLSDQDYTAALSRLLAGASSLFAAAFDGIDLGTGAGRGAFAGRLQDIIAGIASGSVTAGQLGQLNTQQAIDAVLALLDLLKAMGDATVPTSAPMVAGLPSAPLGDLPVPVAPPSLTAAPLAAFEVVGVDAAVTLLGGIDRTLAEQLAVSQQARDFLQVMAARPPILLDEIDRLLASRASSLTRSTGLAA